MTIRAKTGTSGRGIPRVPNVFYQWIQDALDVIFPQRHILQFTGDIVNITDDAANDRTVVDVDGEPGWSGVQVLYVGKHGDDANDGTSYGKAFLTFGAALAEATADTPSSSNRYAIVCEDAGIYAENVLVPSWCMLFAPSAEIQLLSMSADSEARLHRIVVASGNVGITMTAAGTARVAVDEISVGANAIGFLSANAGSILILDCSTVRVGAGSFGGGDGSSGDGHLHATIRDIYLDGNSATGIAVVSPGSVVANIDHILEGGAYSTTRAVWVASGTMDLNVREIVADVAYLVGATGNLRMFVNEMIGTRSVANGGLDGVTTASSIRGSVTSIATGAGYVTLQTSEALLSVANQSCRIGFQVDYNDALASLNTYAGDVALMVAWLNDGTQTIQNLADGTSASGATPVLTGTLATGLGWQATLNASHQVVFALAQDAAIARSGQSRYWVSERVAQVAP